VKLQIADGLRPDTLGPLDSWGGWGGCPHTEYKGSGQSQRQRAGRPLYT